MKKYLLVTVLSLVLLILLTGVAFAGSASSRDQSTYWIYCDGGIFGVTIKNEAAEYWVQYDSSYNWVYYHCSSGVVKNGEYYPFDIYPGTATYLKSNGTTVGTIADYEWDPVPIILPPGDIPYGGEKYKDYYLSINVPAEARVFYGFAAYSDAGLLGTYGDYNSFLLW